MLLGVVINLLILVGISRAPLAGNGAPVWEQPVAIPDRILLEHIMQTAPVSVQEPQKRNESGSEQRKADGPLTDADSVPLREERSSTREGSEGSPTAAAQDLPVLRPRSTSSLHVADVLTTRRQGLDLPVRAATFSGSSEAPELRRGTLHVEYPAVAKRARIEGRVILRFLITPDGRAREIRVIKSLHPACDREAIRALSEARFRPGLQNGIPVPTRTGIAFRFRLEY